MKAAISTDAFCPRTELLLHLPSNKVSPSSNLNIRVWLVLRILGWNFSLSAIEGAVMRGWDVEGTSAQQELPGLEGNCAALAAGRVGLICSLGFLASPFWGE